MLAQFVILLPEIVLTILILVMQLYAVFDEKNIQKVVSSVIILIFGLIFYMLKEPVTEGMFGKSFDSSVALNLVKAMMLAMTLAAIVIYRNLMIISGAQPKMEFISLMLFSTLGAFIAISARDFLLLFCALELQSLSSYALAAFNSKNLKSTESGLKYFVLGSLMSCLMLFGISFLYGFSGTIVFEGIRSALTDHANIALTTGMVLVLAAIFFKLSAAPMHVWTPDVYEGSPISAVTFFASSQKLGILIVLFNIIAIVPNNLTLISADLVKIVAILSMLVGALGAIKQQSLKRLMAYSTILNVGYVLIGVCLVSPAGKHAAFVYMLIYIISVIGFFACLVALFGEKADEATFDDLSNICSNRKALALGISTIMFSMIGLPPLAGFFGKYYLFFNAVEQGEIMLALIGVLTSVIAAFYYLRVVKYIYFAERKQGDELVIIPTNRGLLCVSLISISFIVFFFFFEGNQLLN